MTLSDVPTKFFFVLILSNIYTHMKFLYIYYKKSKTNLK